MSNNEETKITPITLDDLIQAGRSTNTARALRGAVNHFEIDFGGSLPTTPVHIEAYIEAYHTTLSPDTLRQRLAMLATWHKRHGFPDPTKTPRLREALIGCRARYAKPKQRAKPLGLVQLEQVVASIEQRLQQAHRIGDQSRQQRALELTAIRDRCFVLIGFWCGFRSEQLLNLRVEHCEEHLSEHDVDRYITLFLPKSKGDREAKGQTWTLREMPNDHRHLCPVNAYLDWVTASQRESGPLFSKIDRWGVVWDRPLHKNSVIALLRSILAPAGLPAEQYSSHSLRRGFANWAVDNDSSLHDLMSWVKWKDPRSVLPYLEARDDLPNRLLSGSAKTSFAMPQGEEPKGITVTSITPMKTLERSPHQDDAVE